MVSFKVVGLTDAQALAIAAVLDAGVTGGNAKPHPRLPFSGATSFGSPVQFADWKAINAQALQYINRLSDHLFVMARRLNDNGARDVLWQPGANR